MPISDIRELRLLPPLVLARLGSSPDLMDNFDVRADPGTGFLTLIPAPTLTVDPATGRITGETTPATVAFRDGAGRIRPVAPFLEVWARFEDAKPLQPLSTAHLQDLGMTPAEVVWRVRAGNWKAFRRTGNNDDRVMADTGPFADHSAKHLAGTANNFKAGKSIPLGSVQYIQPTPAFPEIRLRFTPAAGKVYGPDPNDPNVVDDVYDAARGKWKGHSDDDANIPESTNPGFIYARDNQNRSLGYLDDTCDGLVVVEIKVRGRPVQASARFSAGPPDFAPDAFPVRSLADELEQMLVGPDVTMPVTPEEVSDLVRHALQTVQLLNTEAMNRGGMASHDRRLGRAFEPIFQPVSRASNPLVRTFHAAILNDLQGLQATPGSPARTAAVAALRRMASLLRDFDKVGDLTNAGRTRMPAMMRGSDALHLALTRRQINKVHRAINDFDVTVPTPTPGGPMTTPEQDMLTLINFLTTTGSAPIFHAAIDTGDGTPMSDLFADPPKLLAYIKTAQGQTGKAAGKKLVVPKQPDQSAFFALITDPVHPMNSRFSQIVPALNKTGIEIVRSWINSL